MSDNMKVLEALIDASGRKDHPAFLELMTEDVVYSWKIGVRPIHGKVKMQKFLTNYEAGFDQKAWTITHWSEKDDVILVEGVEQIYDRARELLIDNPFMQAIEFRDGKISAVRDYYDPAIVSARGPAAAESAR